MIGKVTGIFNPEKIFAHVDRIAEWVKTGYTKPITAELDLTNACNHRCPECTSKDVNRVTPVMKIGTAIDIVHQLYNNGVRGLTLVGGGEPTLHPGIHTVIDEAHRLGLKIGLITNGSRFLFMTDDELMNLVSKTMWIRISLDAGNENMHYQVHGVLKGYQTVIDGVKRLVDAKKKLLSITDRNDLTTIGVAYLTGPKTYDGMREFTEVASNLNVDYAQFRPFVGDNFRPPMAKESQEFLQEYTKCLKYQTINFKVLTLKHKYQDMVKNRNVFLPCHTARFVAIIGADLKMPLCCFFHGKSRFVIGDLKKQTFAEIWNGPRHNNVLKHLTYDQCPAYCRAYGLNQLLDKFHQPIIHKEFI